MALNYSKLVYGPSYQVFARPVNIFPVKSQPGVPPYGARGIFSTNETSIVTGDDSVISDQKTILDILEDEFPIMPKQFDRVEIPAHLDLPELGEFDISDLSTNGGGETTLTLKRRLPARPEP